jgi:hypothetical protein
MKVDPDVPLNLERYALSYGSTGILNAALARSRGALTTSVVLLEMSEQGRPSQDPQWIGDFCARK